MNGIPYAQYPGGYGGSTTPAATTGRAHSIIDSIIVFLIFVIVVIVIIVVIVVVVVGVVVSLLLLLLLLFLKFIKNSAGHAQNGTKMVSWGAPGPPK